MSSQTTLGRGVGRSLRRHRLLTMGALLGAGALIMGACGSGSSSSSANTTIPGASVSTTAPSSGTTTKSSSSTATSAAPANMYGALPAVGTPSKGGTITVGQLTGSTPTYIFPILPAALASVYTAEFQDQLFLPLYTGSNGATPEINYNLGAANAPTFSDGDKTVTIPIKSGLKWSNGQPVTSQDVEFDIDLVKAAVAESAADWDAYTPGLFPQTLASMSTPNSSTLVLHLKQKFNPGFFLNDQLEGNIYAMPASVWNVESAGGAHVTDWSNPAVATKIFNYLSKAGGQVAGFATNSLWKTVDGPFKLSSFSATNSSYNMVPNPDYGGSPKPSISELSVDTETSITAQLDALKSGQLDVAGIDFSQLGDVNSLRSDGYAVYGYPNLGWFGAFFNFEDKTADFNNVIAQLYVRQAMAHLVDQPAYLAGIFKNAGVLAYGPVPSRPTTPFTPADAVTSPYPYSISAAKQLLTSHGWKVGSTTTCAKPGTASDECGAGIPAGTSISFSMYSIPESETPSVSQESEAFASAAAQVGIKVSLQQKTFNYIVSTYNDATPSDAKYTNDWGVINFGGYTDDYFPTQNSIFNAGGDYNQGGYSNPTANTLIHNSVYGSNPDAVTKEASFLTQNVPVLFMPNSDYVYAVSNKVGGPGASFLSLTQFTSTPQYWYLNKS